MIRTETFDLRQALDRSVIKCRTATEVTHYLLISIDEASLQGGHVQKPVEA